ncbi:hypothetical protein BDV93DRAFT_563185 [Ceratobasidium sp. AG-I]|nr:hypothetical protein BDV93DRAFT_563185 [Ceratobasidium sp. AG-I]
MSGISNFVPLPGIHELEALAQWFVGRLKEANLNTDKRTTLARRLECLIEQAKTLENPVTLTNRLIQIQTQLRATDTSGFRLGIRGTQLKLALWDKLSMTLDETMEMSMFTLMAQLHKSQNQQAQTQQAQMQKLQVQQTRLHQTITRLDKRKFKVIDGCCIANQVEICMGNARRTTANPPSMTVNTTLRAGRFGNLSVAYVTFTADSRDAAHEVVNQELDYISQLLHINVAQLVGATEGYNGLNGIVVAMDGIHLDEFWWRTHSGATWARYVIVILPGDRHDVRHITVTPDGHVTMFPFGSAAGQLEGTPADLSFRSELVRDDAVRLLFEIYIDNMYKTDSSHMRTFVDSLAELGPAFTELHVMKLAAYSRMFPHTRSHYFEGSDDSFQTRFGSFGRAKHLNGEMRYCRLLHRSSHLEIWNKENRFQFFSESPLLKSLRGYCWETYSLHGPFQVSPTRADYLGREYSARFSWEDVFREAQQISRRDGIDLDSIVLCNPSFFSLYVYANIHSQ